jgi:flavoprotein
MAVANAIVRAVAGIADNLAGNMADDLDNYIIPKYNLPSDRFSNTMACVMRKKEAGCRNVL